jgi:hypothetical protein
MKLCFIKVETPLDAVNVFTQSVEGGFHVSHGFRVAGLIAAKRGLPGFDALQAKPVFLLHRDNAINLGIDPTQKAECDAVELIGHFRAPAQGSSAELAMRSAESRYGNAQN